MVLVAGVLLVLGVIIALIPSGSRRSATLRDAPWQALDGISQFPPPEPEVPPATPLAPLLVADAPDALAILSPREGATRVERGETLLVRFNRPMVRGSEVGRALEHAPVSFEPAVAGSWRWATRSSLLFTPAVTAFDRNVEASLVVEEELASLDGDALYDDTPRVIVFDGSPRLVGHQPSVAEGEPLALTFDAQVSAAELAQEIFAWEVEGRRPIPLRITAGGFEPTTAEDAPQRFRVDLALGRPLEAGAQIAVALAPRWSGYGGSYPRVVQFALAPRPRFTGIGCEESRWGTARCTFTEDPGQIVDIGPALRLLASERLAALSPSDVRVAPALRDVDVRVEGQGAEQGRVVAIRGEWEPDQVYEVRLGAVQTEGGDRVVPLAPLAVRSAGHPPTVQAPGGTLVYEQDAPIALHVRGIHVDEGRALVRTVPEGREVDALVSPASFVAAEPIEIALPTILPDARANRWGRGTLDARDASGGAHMMVVAFQPGARGTASDLQAAFVQSTDLGVTAEALDRGVLVWVSSIARATAIEGARVELRNVSGGLVAEATTDANGAAWVRSDGRRGSTIQWSPLAETTMIVVRAAGDRAVLQLDPRRGVGPGALGVPQSGGAPDEDEGVVRATVIADRGAYRPGEPMSVLAIARRMEGASATPPSDRPVRFRLMGGSETPIAEASTRLERGQADASWTLPEGVMLGTHRLELIDTQGASLGSTNVTIAEFRQPRFSVDLAAPSGDVHGGDALSIAATARYLFGAPLEGATMRWSIAREGVAPVPVRWSEYAFGPASGAARAGTLAEGEATLDREGAATLGAEVSLASPVRTRLRVEAEVTDATGQTTSASRSIVAYPASFEVGVRRPRSWVGLGSELAIDAIAIDHAGEPVAARAIEARFVREGWHGWWEWHDGAEQEDEGAYQLRRGQRRDVAHTCDLESALEPVRCAFTPARAGTYVLEVEGRDEAGRTTLAQTRVYVAGPDEHPDRDPPGAPIALTPAREEWSVGEEAELAFESPWEGAEALIAVHHGSLLSLERRRVGAGGQVVRVALTDAMVPNVFVTVALVRPRTGEPGERIDLNAPDLRFGSASVRVRPRTSRLEVAIETEGAARPGTRMPIAVHVRDEEGHDVRGARVALWAVDEGTLRLTGYQTPDATGGLFVERGAAFALEDLRRALVSRIDPSIEAEASGDGGYAEGAMDLEERERFDPTPLWAPRLVTGADGVARAELELPARPTEYRVMAIAIDDGLRRGRASAWVVAEQPLVVRAAFPRFATEGDRFEAVAFVHNAGEREITAQVRFHVGGEAREARTITIAAGGEARVSEPIAATSVGVMPLRVEASASVDREPVAHEDGARVPVVPAARWVRRRAVVGGSGERALDLAFGQSPRGELRVAVASHPFVGLDGALDALDESGWGGTEVEASRLLAIASYLRMSEGLRRGGRDEAELRSRAARAIDAIMRTRTIDGGFARWSADEGTQPHETVLALRALIEAQRAGLRVPEGVREAGLRRVEQLVEMGAFGETYGRAGQESWALALRLLGEAGTRGGPLDALYEQREFASPASLAWLALALPEGNRRRETALALAVHRLFPELEIAGLESSARSNAGAPRAVYVEHDVAAIAAVLEAASIVDGGEQWIRELATELLRIGGARQDGLGAPTDVAAAMAALSACAQRFGREGDPLDASLVIGDGAIEARVRGDEGALFDVPWSRVQGARRLLARGGGAEDPIFVALDARWAVPIGEADDVARGRAVALHRVLETAAGTPIEPGARIPLGTMIRVRLFVHVENGTSDRVAVRDPLGAGLESVDAGLRTTPHASLMALLGASPDDDATDARGFHAMRTLSYVEHRRFDVHATTFYLSSLPPGLHELTYAVRATTPGEFVVPPASVEALRDDAFVGRSTALRVIVE
ncbi:alpha-2-macroglobulin family protein [Sandaracinus amylolyticus]|uniref:PAN domain protein n=1 Tax=Sandaracinus amylolyticus TaxID=927083 RepID=A0A0F6W5A7_9BACT|nr:alpha-2-macroglobulin family protein [Sandaracinus amylolyticus]AKF07658.1 PAN domain protein [Sandaracinus amylolyticus]